ncbi:glycosyltransferase [Neosynechococcus sphagnicola]|uniref:glycosyltransferase n=1 Tax=Neosynechococcus sphagnicola TaxID=1501145 RepID=UPI000AFBCDF1|nr:glycosyltransferase [Neosynechococcus sphagnicola]
MFVITGLFTGGAEMMLYKLLSRLNRGKFRASVISLTPGGSLRDQIQHLGIPVYCVGMKSQQINLRAILAFIPLMRKLSPDLIQGWMTHGNLIAQISRYVLSSSVPILWSIRHSALKPSETKLTTRLIIGLLAHFSHLPEGIIYNSRSGAEDHHRIHYAPLKTVIISNGIDTDLFHPSLTNRLKIRQELGLEDHTIIIGLIGRFHVMKGHEYFLQAAALLLPIFPETQFLLVGSEVTPKNPVLSNLVRSLGLESHVHLGGERQDIPRLTAALDIACSTSSFGEGFANVIGEAMACGVPCVVTNVGDAAWIVGETGFVIPPADPVALCEAWKALICMDRSARQALGLQARQRVEAHFALDKIVRQYEAVYEEIFSKWKH